MRKTQGISLVFTFITLFFWGLAPASAGPAEDCKSETVEGRMSGCTKILNSRNFAKVPKTKALFNRGWAHLRRKEYKDAIADYSQLIKLQPTNYGAYNNRGYAYKETQQHQKAVRDFTKAIGLNKTTEYFYRHRAESYFKLGKHAEAIADATQALSLRSSEPLSYYWRGRAQYALTKSRDAFKDLEKYAALSTKKHIAYNHLGYLYNSNFGKSSYESTYQKEALAALGKSIKAKPDYPNPYLQRADIYEKIASFKYGTASTEVQGKKEKLLRERTEYLSLAIKDYSTIIKNNPHHIIARNKRASVYVSVYAKQKQYDKAIADMTTVLRLQPKNKAAYKTRAEYYGMQKKHTLQLADLTQVITLDSAENPLYGFRFSAHKKGIFINYTFINAPGGFHLKAGDIITHVKGTPLKGIRKEKAFDLLQKNKTSPVEFRILRGKKSKPLKVTMRMVYSNASNSYLARGKVYLMLKNKHKALEDYTKAIEKNPYNRDAYKKRASLYSADEVEKKFKDLMKWAKYSQPSDRGDNYDTVALNIRESTNKNPQKRDFVISAYKKSAEAYSQQVKVSNRASAYAKRGIVYYKISELLSHSLSDDLRNKEKEKNKLEKNKAQKRDFLEKSKKDLTKAISLNSENSIYFYIRSFPNHDLGKTELALADLSEAALLNSKNGDIYQKRAIIYLNKKKFELALKNFTRYAGLAKNKSQAYTKVGDHLLDHIKKNPELKKEVEKAYSKAIALNPKNRNTFYKRGNFYLNTEDYKKAIKDFTQWAELSSKKDKAYYALGNTLLNHYAKKPELKEEIIKAFSKAIDINSKHAGAYNGRAWAYFKFGEAAKGLPDVQKSLKLKPNDPAALDTRGHIYEALGQKEKALADIKKALEIDPTQKETQEALKRLQKQD